MWMLSKCSTFACQNLRRGHCHRKLRIRTEWQNVRTGFPLQLCLLLFFIRFSFALYNVFHAFLWHFSSNNTLEEYYYYVGKVLGWEDPALPRPSTGSSGAAGESHVTAALRLFLCHNLCNTPQHFALHFRPTRVHQRCDILCIRLILGCWQPTLWKVAAAADLQQQNLAGISWFESQQQLTQLLLLLANLSFFSPVLLLRVAVREVPWLEILLCQQQCSSAVSGQRSESQLVRHRGAVQGRPPPWKQRLTRNRAREVS